MTTRWDEHKAWFTPSDVGEQGLWAAKAVGVEPDVVIDLGAGAGGILCRVANVWPNARRVAIEIREEERRHLDRWAHEVVIGDFRELRRDHPALRGRRRLVVGNPPYGAPEGEAVDLTTQALAWALEEVLGPDDWVHLLLRKSYEEAEAAWRFFAELAPVFDFRIPARANFRRGVSRKGTKYAGDFIGHRWVLWRPGHHGWCWRSVPLPVLPPASLSWVVRPGTERVAGELHVALRPDFPRVPEIAAPAGEGRAA